MTMLGKVFPAVKSLSRHQLANQIEAEIMLLPEISPYTAQQAEKLTLMDVRENALP